MDYYIVEAASLDLLMESVNRYLAERWVPLGAPFPISTYRIGADGQVRKFYFAQAVTKVKPVVPERRESVVIKL